MHGGLVPVPFAVVDTTPPSSHNDDLQKADTISETYHTCEGLEHNNRLFTTRTSSSALLQLGVIAPDAVSLHDLFKGSNNMQ